MKADAMHALIVSTIEAVDLPDADRMRYVEGVELPEQCPDRTFVVAPEQMPYRPTVLSDSPVNCGHEELVVRVDVGYSAGPGALTRSLNDARAINAALRDLTHAEIQEIEIQGATMQADEEGFVWQWRVIADFTWG